MKKEPFAQTARDHAFVVFRGASRMPLVLFDIRSQDPSYKKDHRTKLIRFTMGLKREHKKKILGA